MLLFFGLLVFSSGSDDDSAAVVVSSQNPSGAPTVELRAEDMVVSVVPSAGCNVRSIEYKNREILRQAPSIAEQSGFLHGVPLLYPTPNRVRDSTFRYEGQTFEFPANNDAHFLHGLVHSAPFTLVDHEAHAKASRATFQLEFRPDEPWFEKFPFEHVLRIALEVKPDRLRWTYTVDNSKGKKPIPYGFGVHPWFLYQGSRAKTRLTVPATDWMEAVELLPTGKLVPLDGSRFDARGGLSLDGFVIDDVYFGMTEDSPARIDFEETGLSIDLHASPEFTHMVVYTPEAPWFCVENQTCSTDAHNLYARGLVKESHLLIVPAGKTQSGWVEYIFHDRSDTGPTRERR